MKHQGNEDEISLHTPFRFVLNKRRWRLGPPQAISNGHMRLCSQGTCEQ